MAETSFHRRLCVSTSARTSIILDYKSSCGWTQSVGLSLSDSVCCQLNEADYEIIRQADESAAAVVEILKLSPLLLVIISIFCGPTWTNLLCLRLRTCPTSETDATDTLVTSELGKLHSSVQPYLTKIAVWPRVSSSVRGIKSLIISSDTHQHKRI